MTNQSDPIEEIIKTEEEAKKSVERHQIKKEQEFKAAEEEEERKLAEFEQNLRNEGNKKLDDVKQEAGELMKSKIATASNEQNSKMRECRGSMDKAVDTVVSIFMEHTN
ncbi:hypothetical protein KJ632_03095 [Patescibacteria group bacterium]|nr:hypothetical protein [Patescibacteria group bacterium]